MPTTALAGFTNISNVIPKVYVGLLETRSPASQFYLPPPAPHRGYRSQKQLITSKRVPGCPVIVPIFVVMLRLSTPPHPFCSLRPPTEKGIPLTTNTYPTLWLGTTMHDTNITDPINQCTSYRVRRLCRVQQCASTVVSITYKITSPAAPHNQNLRRYYSASKNRKVSAALSAART